MIVNVKNWWKLLSEPHRAFLREDFNVVPGRKKPVYVESNFGDLVRAVCNTDVHMVDCDAVHRKYYTSGIQGYTEPHFTYEDLDAVINKVASRPHN